MRNRKGYNNKYEYREYKKNGCAVTLKHEDYGRVSVISAGVVLLVKFVFVQIIL